jgi:hypothetical protein
MDTALLVGGSVGHPSAAEWDGHAHDWHMCAVGGLENVGSMAMRTTPAR